MRSIALRTPGALRHPHLQAGLTAAPGGVLELVAADISQAATLTPGMFKDVRQLMSCTAVKVVPKEGDTVDRAKYMQGAWVVARTRSGGCRWL